MFRAPLCPSSGAQEYYTGGCCLSYLVLWFSSCRNGVELSVMCLVCGLLLQQPANRTNNPVSGMRAAVASSVASTWHFISTYKETYSLIQVLKHKIRCIIQGGNSLSENLKRTHFMLNAVWVMPTYPMKQNTLYPRTLRRSYSGVSNNNINNAQYYVIQYVFVITPNIGMLAPIPMAARSKTSVCGRSLAGIAGSTPAEGIDVCLLWVFVTR